MRRTTRRVWFATVLCISLLSLTGVLKGCGPGGESTTCSENGDCLGDQICQNKKCVERKQKGCQSNSDCSAPMPTCEIATGKCKAECELNSQCPSGQVCTNGVCKPGASPECVWDKDCGAGKVCREQKCVADANKECYGDQDCENKPLRYCATNNTCAWECKADSDCGVGRRCIDHACKVSGECSSDEDCSLPTGKCDTAQRKCVACLSNQDCPSNKVCNQQRCEDKPGCASDQDCTAPTGKCETSSGQCFECLADTDCPTGEACDNKSCKAKSKGCNPACQSGSFCFVDEKCIPEWKSCKEDKDCATGQVCLDPGAGSVCLTLCDPTKNTSETDETNATCYGGYGICLGTSNSDPTKGACVPPYKKRRKHKETCQNLGNPQKADYHDCADADTLCVDDNGQGFCWKTCDPAKNKEPNKISTNPSCDGGKGTCYPLSDGKGVCEPVRPKTQKKDQGCLDPDPNKAEWNDCSDGFVCVKNKCVPATQGAGQVCNGTDKLCKSGLSCLLFDQTNNIAYCKQTCDPTNPSCPSGFLCQAVSFTDPTAGACIDERKKIRKKDEACQGEDPTKPEWNDCANNAPCVQGKCGEPRAATRNKGEFCELGEKTDATYGSCKSGLRCWSNTCLTACDPTASNPTCAADEKCVAADANKPKEGVCRPFQGLECEPNKTACPTGYFCFKFNYTHRCVKPCNPGTNPSGCAANHTCQHFDLNDPTKGYCILDRLPIRKKGETCDYTRPEDPQYHGCKAPLVCMGLTCVDKPPATESEGALCDDKKGCKSPLVCTASDTGQSQCARACNPYKKGICGGNEICVPKQADKFYWSGGCFTQRTPTQGLGQACKRNNPTRPEYNECVGNYVCVGSGGDTYCREACDLKTPKCPNNYTCTEYTQGKGACLRKRNQTRNEGESCGAGDENDPGYDNCIAGHICVTFDSATKLNLCVKSCNPSQSTCASTHRCVGVDFFDPTKGACIPNRSDSRQVGESCEENDPRQPGYNKCLQGDHCQKNVCLDCLEDKHCKTDEKCRQNQCVNKSACLADADCTAPKAKCQIVTQTCVACLVDNDCPSGEGCQANACVKKNPGCQKNSDCAAPTAYCQVSSGKCVGCLTNANCPTNNICQAGTCKPNPNPPGCNPACKSGEYCYASQKCIANWKNCTSNTDCSTTEVCTRLGASTVCLPKCDPTKNKSATDRTNPSCYGGFGICLPLSTANQGVCTPPPLKTRNSGETCLVRDQPTKPEYNDCKTGLECWKGKCQKARTKTQPVGSQCNRDGVAANHNDCVSTAVCVGLADGSWCRQSCNTQSPNCKTGFTCRALTSGRGACFKNRTDTQKIGEACGSGNVGDKSYNNCATGLTCLQFNTTTGLNLCVRNCSVSNPSCPNNHTCLRLSSGSSNGVCISDRLRTRKDKETCGGPDPRKADWNDCVPGYGCYQNKCIARTQSKGEKCDSQKLLCKESNSCIVFDSAKGLNFCLTRCNPRQSACPQGSRCVSTSSTVPTQGACVPSRTTTRKEGETCGSNDLGNASYNSCSTGLTCMGNATNGYHCLPNCNPDASNPGCRSGYRCVKLSAGRGACAQTCTAQGTCKYGSACTDPGNALGYKICM